MVGDEEIQDIYKKGIEAYRRGDLSQASHHLMQVVETDEHDHRAWNALGVVLTKMGKYQDADVCFENALILDQGNAVYERNRVKNSSHVKKDMKELLSSGYFSLPANLPFGLSAPYLIGGILLLLILIALLAVIIPPFFQPEPLATSAGDIQISIEQLDDLILVRNNGGAGLEKVAEFLLTGNNQTIHSLSGLPRNLGTSKGSTLGIPHEDLYPISDDNTVTIRLSARYVDDSERPVLNQKIILPVLVNETAVMNITPVLIPYDPQYKTGDILINESGSYLLVSDILPDNQYRIQSLNRRNEGLFFIQPYSAQNMSMQETEQSSIKSAMLQIPAEGMLSPDIPYQAVRNDSSSGIGPLYVPGDVVSSSKSSSEEAFVILGFDSGTDEYAFDNLYQYHSGEWGYRPDALSEWKDRSEFERSYPVRVTRIALSQVGIGEESSPPGTQPLYKDGDIVAKDRGADASLLLIMAYDPLTNSYATSPIWQSYNGGWERAEKSEVIIRSALEKEYSYRVRTIDSSLVKVR